MPEDSVSQPLQDVVDMVNERPNLTQEEWEIVNKAVPYLKAQIRPEVRTELEVEYAKKMSDELDNLKTINKKHIDEQFEALKKSQEPMGEDELAKLLSQKYIEFPVPLRVPNGDGSRIVKEFIICEQPSLVEEKFFKLLKKALIPVLQERESISFKLDSGSLIEKIQTVLDASEAALELGSSLVALCLDPWEEDKNINSQWVRKNLSTQRQAGIILAQFECNKYRDFFSQGFRSFLKLRQ